MELADIEGLSELGGSSGPQVGNGQLADLVSDCLTRLGDVAVDLVLERERKGENYMRSKNSYLKGDFNYNFRLFLNTRCD